MASSSAASPDRCGRPTAQVQRIVLLVAAGAVAGCSGAGTSSVAATPATGSPPTAPPPPATGGTSTPAGATAGPRLDGCPDLDAAAAAALLGTAVGPGRPDTDVPYPTCTYHAVADSRTSVGISEYTGSQAVGDLLFGAPQLGAIVPVPGLGERSLTDRQATVLIATAGRRGCEVVLAGVSLPGTVAQRTEALARVCAPVIARP